MEQEQEQFPSQAFLKDYGVQIAKATQAATLRAVGEALNGLERRPWSLGGNVYYVWVEEGEIEALRQGKMPEGWGK